jgi:hypothetical protein
MMDQAYFVGRGELLDFLNNLLDLQLTKIEQTASGAIACQLTEYIFPKCIAMSRVNWEARYVTVRSITGIHVLSVYFDFGPSHSFPFPAPLRIPGLTMNSSTTTNSCRLHLVSIKYNDTST